MRVPKENRGHNEDLIKNDRAALIERSVRELAWLTLGVLVVVVVGYILFWARTLGLDADMDVVNAARGGV